MATIESMEQIRLKRLRFRSWHRGCKETDLILGHFSDAMLEKLTLDEVNLFEQLLEESDADIWDWLTGKTSPPSAQYDALLSTLRQFRAL